LTNSGSQVLDTLEVSHPIARFIVDNAKSQGSGATAFVLILAALVREVVRHISTIRDSEQLRELSSLGRAFATIKCQWLDAIVLPELLQAAVCTQVFTDQSTEVAEAFRAAAGAIAHTALSGTFAPSTGGTLRELLLEWVFHCIGSLSGSFDTKLRCIADSIPQSIIKVAHAPLSKSHVLKDGLLLRKGLLRHHSSALVEVKPAKFVILECELVQSAAHDETKRGFSVRVSGVAQFKRVLAHDGCKIRLLMRALADLQVNLIISTEELPDPVAECCAELGMIAVQCADIEETAALAKQAAIMPLTSAANVECADVGNAESAREVWMGGRAFLLVKGARTAVVPSIDGQNCAQLVLCAPAQGMCDQYKDALQRCVLMLSSWAQFQPLGVPSFAAARCCAESASGAKAKTCAFSLAGAAAPEISLHQLLERVSADILSAEQPFSLRTYAVCEGYTIRLRTGPGHEFHYSGFKLKAGALFVADLLMTVPGVLPNGNPQLFLRVYSR
jgi:hypothetical protein